MRKIEIVNNDNKIINAYKEHVTEINGSGRKVDFIDMSDFDRNRMIVLNDENHEKICRIYVPQTMLVRVFL